MSVALVRAACTVLGESEIHIIRSYAHGKVYRLYGRVEGDSQKTDRADAPSMTVVLSFPLRPVGSHRAQHTTLYMIARSNRAVFSTPKYRLIG